MHNNSQSPLIRYDGIKIPTGYVSDVGVKRTYQDRLSSPYGTCRDDTSSYSDSDSEYYKKTIKLTKYSARLCYEICLQNMYIISKCNCSDPSIPITDLSQTLCTGRTKLDCVESVRDLFDSSDLSSSCGQYCPTECSKIAYDTSVSMSDYPSEYYYSIVSKQPNLIQKFSGQGNVTYSNFKLSVLMVNVYYRELSYTLIEESATYSLLDIVGIVG